MNRTFRFAVSVAISLAACCALLSSCGDEGDEFGALPAPCDRVGQLEFTGSGRGVIGPEGGLVEVTDPFSPIAGVRVEVLPGSWAVCREVHINYATIFETPNYPTGYVPFERPGPSGSVEIEIGLSTQEGFDPDLAPLPFKLSFPMANIQPKALDIRSAYFFDDAQQTWRINFPDALSVDRLTVATSRHDALWSWGRITIGEVDFDQHVKPAMEVSFGNDTVTAIQAKLDDIRRQAEAQQWAFTCGGLAAAEAFFAGQRDAAYSRVDAIQTSLGCGPCNPLTEQFDQGLEEYWKVEQWEVLFSFADVMFPPTRALEIVIFPLEQAVQNEIFNALTPNTPCNYDCYFEKVPSVEIRVMEAVYYGSDWVRGIIERYRTRAMNPPCPL